MRERMMEEINRDRFWAGVGAFEQWCAWANTFVDWDALGATYISIGIWLIIVGVCTREEEDKTKAHRKICSR